jgi:hypothetical protein
LQPRKRTIQKDKEKRQAKGRTNFEISALAIRSKYSKHGNHFNAGDIISIAKSKYGEFDFVFISFLRTNHDNFFLLLMELNDFKAFQGADIDGKFLILLNAHLKDRIIYQQTLHVRKMPYLIF